MERRLQLHAILQEIAGSNTVYFQPPSSIDMTYPCIVYNRENQITDFADNVSYKNKRQYLVTVIDQDPDSEIPDKVAALPACTYSRFFAVDNLNHDVFNLFF